MKRVSTRIMKCLYCPTEMPVGDDVVRLICATCIMAGKKFPQDVQTEFPQLVPNRSTLADHHGANDQEAA